MRITKTAVGAIALLCCAGLSACVVRPPTIAHVHIGHAVTAVHVTPGHKGYMALALQRAEEAEQAAKSAAADSDLGQLKMDVATAVDATNSTDNFGLKEALTMSANHITFAATSADASENVVKSAPIFAQDITAVIGRCEYIGLLGKDVEAAKSQHEAVLLAREILKLTVGNLRGDANGDGVLGAVPANYGVLQLRAEIEAMIERERPRYRTVDEWYLFNLVRLPNGRWVYDKLGRGGNIDGYK